MPKTVSDYTKNVIYKIQHNDDDTLLYVGHTTNFIKRKSMHKYNCGTNSSPVYKMIRENGGWECFTMIVIQNFPCESKIEACIEEDRTMREMKASMNGRRAYVSSEEKTEYQKGYMKEYNERNKEQIRESKKEYMKEYNERNKEPISEYQREYRQANKELFSEKDRNKYQANKEAILGKAKEYRQANKELISEKSKEKTECECGCIIRKGDIAKHKKTKKHLESLK